MERLERKREVAEEPADSTGAALGGGVLRVHSATRRSSHVRIAGRHVRRSRPLSILFYWKAIRRRFTRRPGGLIGAEGPGWQVSAPEVHRLATLPDNQQTQISLLTHYRAPLSGERAALNHKALI